MVRYALWLLLDPWIGSNRTPARLLEYAATYFDVSSFPDGETKRALQRIVNKRAGKATGRVDSPAGGSGKNGRDGERPLKKRKS